MKELSDEQLRIAVAEAMGWTRNDPPLGDLWYHQDSPHCQDGRYCDEDAVPNYPASLDACASFEATLIGTDNARWYAEKLIEMLGSQGAVFADARARCLAYLATVAPGKLK